MSRPKKAKESGPDLFGPSKSVESSTRGIAVASTCGQVAGIPASLATALASLRDVLSRCESARAIAGILDAAQAQGIGALTDETKQWIQDLENWQREIDAMVRAGIALPAGDELELV